MRKSFIQIYNKRVKYLDPLRGGRGLERLGRLDIKAALHQLGGL